MKCFMGVDLGSTTTKAVVLGEDGEVLGRGITNSRSNYDTAARVAQREALTDTRFRLLHQAVERRGGAGEAEFLEQLGRTFRREQFLEELDTLETTCRERLEDKRMADFREQATGALDVVFARIRESVPALFAPGAERKSDFFRDIAGSLYHEHAEAVAREQGVDYDRLANIYDRSILDVESHAEQDAEALLQRALDHTLAEGALNGEGDAYRAALADVLENPLDVAYVVGTGYGRARLPFSKEHVRSEILCHGLGAHIMYPGTRTVLDIGGQDTKAIQVDSRGIVESFQMNDRCAAGCGRYLGYIADEMQLGLHELGPMAMQATRSIKINSTCTVFAGAELRDRLALGEKREDVLAGLHRAIILRAMSLLSRSGGVRDEFTFTGGVAKNEAAVTALAELIEENYGERKMNIDPNSIYTGALGAATFALRAVEEAAA